MSSTLTYPRDISDIQLLRALAAEIPACAPETRRRLLRIADFMDGGVLLGSMRCHKCGTEATIWIKEGKKS